MQSAILKRSLVLRGHKTSVSLEDEFWSALKDIASSRRMTATQLISEVDSKRQPGNLSSMLRVMVLLHYRQYVARLSATRQRDLETSEI